MKRYLIAIAIFLLVGALLNVCIAWALQLWGKQPIPDPENISGHLGTLGPSERSSWARASGQGWPERPNVVWVQEFVGGRFTDLFAQSPEVDSTGLTEDEHLELIRTQFSYTVEIVERGWPARTVSMERWYEFHYPGPFQWQCNGYPVAGRYIPIRLLWGGFVANTVVYAAFFAAAVAAPFLAVRFLRARRGCCLNCGYPVGDSSQCPECGQPVRDGVT